MCSNGLLLAEKMGFEPMHHVYLRSTPLAGEPLEPLGYFSNCAAERSRLDYDNTKIGNSQSLFGNKKRKILVCFCGGERRRQGWRILKYLCVFWQLPSHRREFCNIMKKMVDMKRQKEIKIKFECLKNWQSVWLLIK